MRMPALKRLANPGHARCRKPCLARPRAPHADRRGDHDQQRAGELLRLRPVRQVAIRQYAFARPVADYMGLWRGNPRADHRPSATEELGAAFALRLFVPAAALLLTRAGILVGTVAGFTEPLVGERLAGLAVTGGG